MFLDLALILTFSVHLLAVNIASAAPFFAVAFEWRGTHLARRSASRLERATNQQRGPDENATHFNSGDDLTAGIMTADRLAQAMARWSVASLIVGAILGFVMLGLLWSRYPRTYEASLAHVDRTRLWWGLVELLFSLACMLAYLRSWRLLANHRVWHRLLGLLAGTNLIYHFPTLFAIIDTLVAEPQLLDRPYRHVSLLLRPDVLIAISHYGLASFAVTAIFGVLLVTGRHREKEEDSEAHRLAVWCGRLALGVTLLQFPVGMTLLMTLPDISRSGLLGHDPVGSLLFGASLVATVALVHRLASISFGDVAYGESRRTMALVAIVILLMVGARQRARQPLLNAAERPSTVRNTLSIAASDQFAPFILQNEDCR